MESRRDFLKKMAAAFLAGKIDSAQVLAPIIEDNSVFTKLADLAVLHTEMNAAHQKSRSGLFNFLPLPDDNTADQHPQDRTRKIGDFLENGDKESATQAIIEAYAQQTIMGDRATNLGGQITRLISDCFSGYSKQAVQLSVIKEFVGNAVAKKTCEEAPEFDRMGAFEREIFKSIAAEKLTKDLHFQGELKTVVGKAIAKLGTSIAPDRLETLLSPDVWMTPVHNNVREMSRVYAPANMEHYFFSAVRDAFPEREININTRITGMGGNVRNDYAQWEFTKMLCEGLAKHPGLPADWREAYSQWGSHMRNRITDLQNYREQASKENKQPEELPPEENAAPHEHKEIPSYLSEETLMHYEATRDPNFGRNHSWFERLIAKQQQQRKAGL